jgi:hypothetical protein
MLWNWQAKIVYKNTAILINLHILYARSKLFTQIPGFKKDDLITSNNTAMSVQDLWKFHTAFNFYDEI